MARIETRPEWDLPSIVAAAGGNPDPFAGTFRYADDTYLEVDDVDQDALDTALAAYDDDEAARRVHTETARALARRILEATDWTIIRHADTGEPIPADVAGERTATRGLVDKIEKARSAAAREAALDELRERHTETLRRRP